MKISNIDICTENTECLGEVQINMICLASESIQKQFNTAVLKDKSGNKHNFTHWYEYHWRGRARMQVPTTRNYTLELPTLGVIAGVNPVEVQWKGLILRGPPSWSRCLSRQVSMLLVPPLTLYTRWWWDAIAVVRGFPPLGFPLLSWKILLRLILCSGIYGVIILKNSRRRVCVKIIILFKVN